jgi:hypothetical protein
MLKEDFFIHSTVRRILARSNIDSTKIEFGTVRGVVYFRGFFQVTRVYVLDDDDLKRYLKSQDFIRKTLASFEKKVRELSGVKDVVFQLTNWNKEKGQWKPFESKKKVEKNGQQGGSNL